MATDPKKRALSVPSDAPTTTDELLVDSNAGGGTKKGTGPSGGDTTSTANGYTLTGDEDTDLDNIAAHYKPSDLDDNTWRGIWKSVFRGESSGNLEEGESTYGKLPKGQRASGGMQVLPKTAKGLGFTDEEFQNPYYKFMAGVKNLRTDYDELGKDKRVQSQDHRIALALAAYHAGRGNVIKSLDKGEDGVPDVSDGKVNTREYTKERLDYLKQYLSAGDRSSGSDLPALLTEEELAKKYDTANEGLIVPPSQESKTGVEGKESSPIGKGTLDDPEMKKLMEMNPAQRGLAIIDKLGVDPAMVALDEEIRGKMGVVTPASHPHKINRSVPVTFEIKKDAQGNPHLTADEVRDAVTIALTGDTSLPAAFRQATGENPGEFLDPDEGEKWLKRQIESGAMRISQVGDKFIAEGNVPVQNWVVNRINALAKGGVSEYARETARMRQEMADSERGVAEEEYSKAISEAKAAKDDVRAAELQAELDARYPKTLTEDLTDAIKRGTARGINELLRTGMNIEQIVEAPLVDAITDEKGKREYVGQKAREAMQARLLKGALEAKTPSGRRFVARMAEAAMKEVVYSPVYMMGGAVMGPAGLIYSTAIRDADKPMDQFLESVASSIVELPFGTAFKGLIAGKDVGLLAAKGGAMASGGIGEVAGDAFVEIAKGQVPQWENALSNLIIGAAFELGEGSHKGTHEGGYQMKGVGEGGSVPTELRSFLGVTQGEDGQIRFQGVIKQGENVSLVEIDPQHPLVLKYALQAQKGGIPFVSMTSEDFDSALNDFKGVGKVALPKMTAEQTAAYLRGEQTVRMEKGKLVTAGEKTNDQENVSGVQGDERVGEEPIETESVEGRSGEPTSASGVLQTPRGSEGGSSEAESVSQEAGSKTGEEAAKVQTGEKSSNTKSGVVLSAGEQKQAEREASLTDTESRHLESAYDKLATTDEKEIRSLFRQADRRFVKKIQGTTEGEFAQAAFERVSKLTTEEQQALAKVIGENFAAPSKTPTVPGETGDYSASIQSMTNKEFEANPQLVANEREVGKFLEEAKEGKVATAQTAEEAAEAETTSEQYQKEQKSIKEGEKKVKVGRVGITLPKDIAAKWDQADLNYETTTARVQNSKLSVDEKKKQLRNAVEERKKARNFLIDEYRRREAEQVQRGYMRNSQQPVAILEENGDRLTVQVAGENAPREVDRSQVETVKERRLTPSGKVKLPTGIRIKLGLGDFSETKQASHRADGVIYVNDNARSAIEDALEVSVDRGLTVKGDKVPQIAKELREAGLKRVAKQLENAAEGRAGAAIVPVRNDDAAVAGAHEAIHTVALDKQVSDDAIRRLYRDGTATRNLLNDLQTSKDKTIREEFTDINPRDFLQEVLAYGATGDHDSLGVSPDLLYDALVEVASELNNAFPNEDIQTIAENALINFDAIMKEASRRDINEEPKQAVRAKAVGKGAGASQVGEKGPSKAVPQGQRDILHAEETRADRLFTGVRELTKGEGPVSIEELRDKFLELRLEKFHDVLKELVDTGRVFPHRIDNANQLNDKAREKLLKIGKDYFNSVTVRTNPVSDILRAVARGDREEVNTREANFKKWFGDSEVVDEDGSPLITYHGTTHDFEIFNKKNASIENFVGQAFYFSTNARDAAGNYGHDGADLTNRISSRIENSESEREYQLDELRSQLEDAESDEEREDLEGQIQELKDDDLFRDKIKREMTGKAEVVVIPAYISAKNLFDISKNVPREKRLHADVEVISEEGADELETGEPTGTLIDFIDNFYEAVNDFTDVAMAEKVKAKFIENLPDELWYEGGSVTHRQAFDAAKDAMIESYMEEYLDFDVIEPGTSPNGEILRRAIEASGFDGVKMIADEYFGDMRFMQDVKYDDRGMLTEHYIVWKPEQVKSPFNNGDFNPEERSFLRKVDKRNEEKSKKFEKDPNSLVLSTTSSNFRDLRTQPIDNGFEGEIPKAVTADDKVESKLIEINRKDRDAVTVGDAKKVITDGRFAVMTGGSKRRTQALKRELNSMGYKTYDANDGVFIVLNSQFDIANAIRLGARYKTGRVLIGDSGSYRAPFTRNTTLGRIGSENYSRENKVEFDVTDGVRVKLPNGVVTFNVGDVYQSKRKQDAAEKRQIQELTDLYKKSFTQRAKATTNDLHDWLMNNQDKIGQNQNIVVAHFLQGTTAEIYGDFSTKKLSDEDANAIRARRAVRDGLAVVRRALSGQGQRQGEQDTGLSWYAASIKKMHEITGQAFPEVMNHPQLRALFDLTLAMSSQGNKVRENYKYAVDIWRRMIEEFELGRDGTDRVYPTKLKTPTIYKEKGEIVERSNYGRFGPQLEKFNFLTQGYVPVGSYEQKQLKKQGVELKKTDEFEKINGAQQWYKKDPELEKAIEKYGHIGGVFEYLLSPGSTENDPYKATEVLGPKIGAFFLNIAGFSQLVTVDMWASRWFYRLNGGLLNPTTPKGTQDTPVNGTDGDIIRGAMQGIANEYNKRHENKITPADVQAILWYSEKDIWKLAGAEDSGTIDFAQAAEKQVSKEMVADISGAAQVRDKVINDFQASSPMGDRIRIAGGEQAKHENENFFVRQMALPARIGLSATSRKQIINRKLLTYDAKEWERHAEWAKGEPLDQNEKSDLYNLLQQGFRATNKTEHDKAIDDLQNFVDNVSSMNIFEFLLNARRAGMLSGIKTAGRNSISNLAHLIAEELKRGATPLDMALSLMSTDKDRTVQGISARGIWNGIKSLPEGFKAFKDTIVKGNTGATYETFNLGYDPHVTPSWMTGGKAGARVLNATVGNFAKYVFRFQAAQDAVFRTYAYNRAMYEVAWLENKNGGRKIADVLANPTVAQSDMAWRAAEFAVFQNDNFINTGYQRWKGNRSEVIKYVLDYELPFIKTGSNIFLQTMDYLLIGSAVKATTALSKETLRDISKADFKKLKQKAWKAIDDPDTRAAIVEAAGRGLVGLTLSIIGYKLAAAGLMYGFGDEDEKERQRRIAQGAGPGHMKLGNHWIDIRAISPIGTMMLAGASAFRAQNKELSGENTRVDAYLRLFSTLVTDGLPMARTADEFLNPKQAQSYAKRLIGAGSLVPAIVSEAAAVQDKVQREQKGEGLKESIKKEVQARLPKTPLNPNFNRQTLPAKTDVFGRELQQPLGFDPFNTKQDTTNAVTQEAAKTGWSMTPPKRDTKKGESVADFQARKKQTQVLIDRVFTELVNDTKYPSTAPVEERKEILDDSAALARRAIKTGEKVSDAELQEIVNLTLDKWKQRADVEKDKTLTPQQKKQYKNRISSKYSQIIKAGLSDE